MENGNKKVVKRGATRHCCYGICKSDSHYSDRDHMKDVSWIPFPKPRRSLEKCLRWIHACGRDHFRVENVNRWTYICNKHFGNKEGPTPDVPANLTPAQEEKFSKKRKPPTPRTNPISKKLKYEVAETLVNLQDFHGPSTATTNGVAEVLTFSSFG
ncbi:hypothetical protein ScPMuIL_002895 [Solemya velum]